MLRQHFWKKNHTVERLENPTTVNFLIFSARNCEQEKIKTKQNPEKRANHFFLTSNTNVATPDSLRKNKVSNAPLFAHIRCRIVHVDCSKTCMDYLHTNADPVAKIWPATKEKLPMLLFRQLKVKYAPRWENARSANSPQRATDRRGSHAHPPNKPILIRTK